MRWRSFIFGFVLTACGALVSVATGEQIPRTGADRAGELPGDRAGPGTPAHREYVAGVQDALDAQLAALDRTRDLLAAKRDGRDRELRQRVRAAYRLLRPGWTPLWLDREQLRPMVAQRSALRRVLARDIAEIALLDEEMTAVLEARRRIATERERAESIAPPAAKSLHLPVAWGRVVAKFGLYRHQQSGTRLSRRGIWLSSRPGRNVRAVSDGTAVYTGPVRGLGQAVVVDHAGYLSILGPLNKVRTVRGSPVSRAAILGEAAGEKVYVEIRLDIGPGGHPIDPEPLLARSR